MGRESKCKTCNHAIRKEPCYDVKCLKLQRYIYDEGKYMLCDCYEAKKNVKTNRKKMTDDK